MTLSVIEIMQLHRKVREAEGNELSEFKPQSLRILDAIDVGPCQLDIGILAAGYMFDSRECLWRNLLKSK